MQFTRASDEAFLVSIPRSEPGRLKSYDRQASLVATRLTPNIESGKTRACCWPAAMTDESKEAPNVNKHISQIDRMAADYTLHTRHAENNRRGHESTPRSKPWRN